MVDALVLGTSAFGMGVRLPPLAPAKKGFGANAGVEADISSMPQGGKLEEYPFLCDGVVGNVFAV